MSSFNELMQRFVNTDYEDLVTVAKDACNDVFPAVKNYFGEVDTAVKFMVAVIGTCIGADGALTELEKRFAYDVIGDSMTPSFLDSMTTVYGDNDSRNLVDEIIDSLNSDAKASLLVFCAAFLAVDETISRPEVAFISKLMQ